jgi:hypothetical protein
VGSSAGPQQLTLTDGDTGAEYRGKAPYIIVDLDGRERQILDQFTPKIASAAVLERFYNVDTGSQVVETLNSAMGLLNDVTYLQKAKRIQLPAPGTAEYDAAKKLYDAYVANIRDEALKPR